MGNLKAKTFFVLLNRKSQIVSLFDTESSDENLPALDKCQTKIKRDKREKIRNEARRESSR